MNGAVSQGSAWRLVIFLLLLHVINQIDRQLVSAFAADIMRDLALDRGQFALIAGLAFSGVYAFTALAAGVLADRLGRVPVLASGVGVWSIFTTLSGFAQGFWSLLAARPFVAAGEATLVPTATNIILARVDDRHKSGALGLFFAGIPLGIGSGFLIAGLLGPVLGWRGTFILMGLIGTAAVAAVLRMKDVAPDPSYRPSFKANLSELMAACRARPRALWASLAMIVAHAHVATSPFVQLWLVSEKGYLPGHAAQLYGGMFVIIGLVGTFGAGVLGDWGKRRFGWDRAATVMVMLMVLAPLLPVYRLVPGGTPWFLVGMAASILFMTVIYGPLFAVIEEELPPHLKATSTGFNILVLNILSIGGVSLAIGMASDRLAALGHARSWSLPLMGADLLAALAIGFTWLAFRLPAGEKH